MPTFTAHFFTVADWAKRTIKARSAKHALRLAPELYDEHTKELDFQSYDASKPDVEHIEVRTASGDTVAEWQTDDLRVRLAAGDLLAAAQGALDYLTDHAIDLDGEPEQTLAGIRLDLADAIARAKGGAS